MYCEQTDECYEKEYEPKDEDKALFQNEQGEFYLAVYDSETGQWWAE
jgi:hypothetical protein